jgi:hypothetical protein
METKCLCSLRRRIARSLACWLLLQGCLQLDCRAQTALPATLQIVILEGDGAINNIRQRTAREPVVQVVDENRKPVAGAMVLFSSPDRGAGAVFSNGSKTFITYTDAEGKASAKGMRPNQTSGQYQIVVNASFRGLVAVARIAQANAVAGAAAGAAGAGAATGVSKTLIAILVVAAGAAATGAVVAARGGAGTPQAPPTAVINTSGTPVFSPPN